MKAILFSVFLMLALAVPALGQNRELGCHFGLGLADFHGCPAFGLAAAVPLSSPVSLEAEFFYYFNPADKVKNPPAGFHQSSMAADYSPSVRAVESRSRFLAALAAGVRLRPSRNLGLQLEARWLVLSAGGGRVLRTSAGLYTFF